MEAMLTRGRCSKKTLDQPSNYAEAKLTDLGNIS